MRAFVKLRGLKYLYLCQIYSRALPTRVPRGGPGSWSCLQHLHAGDHRLAVPVACGDRLSWGLLVLDLRAGPFPAGLCRHRAQGPALSSGLAIISGQGTLFISARSRCRECRGYLAPLTHHRCGSRKPVASEKWVIAIGGPLGGQHSKP